jgi:hypothetical protein
MVATAATTGGVITVLGKGLPWFFRTVALFLITAFGSGVRARGYLPIQ